MRKGKKGYLGRKMLQRKLYNKTSGYKGYRKMRRSDPLKRRKTNYSYYKSKR